LSIKKSLYLAQVPEYFAVLVNRPDGAPAQELCDLTASLPQQWQV